MLVISIHHCFCIIMTLYKHRVGDPRASSVKILHKQYWLILNLSSIPIHNWQTQCIQYIMFHPAIASKPYLKPAIIIGRYSITMCLIIFRGGRAVMMGGNCGNRPVITRCGSAPLGGICSIHNLINSPFEQTNRWLIFTLPCFLSPNPLTGRVKLNYNGSSGWRRHRWQIAPPEVNWSKPHSLNMILKKTTRWCARYNCKTG